MILRSKATLQLFVIGILLTSSVLFFEYIYYPFPNGLRETADDPSYVQPALNFIQKGSWQDHSIGPSAFVQRPPLIGILHWISFIISRNYHGWIFLGVALLFHAWSLVQLYRIILHFTAQKWALWFTLIYAAFPCYWGFVNYAISEAFALSIGMLLLAFVLLSKVSNWLKITVTVAIIWLLRPVLILLFIPFLFQLLRSAFKHVHLPKKSELFLIFGCFAACISWEIRKHHYMGEWFVVHPIYHTNNGSQFRPAHAAMTNLFRNWETRPEIFHEWMGKCWNATPISEQEVKTYCHERKIPLSAKELYHLLCNYQASNLLIEQTFGYKPTVSYLASEQSVVNTTNAYIRRLSTVNFYNRWVKTPLVGCTEQFPKSQLNASIFQEKFRGNFLIEVLRYSSVGLIFLSFICVITLLLFFKTTYTPISIGILLYFFFLFWIQVMNEDRYLVPAWSFAFIAIPVFLYQLRSYLLKHYNKFRSTI